MQAQPCTMDIVGDNGQLQPLLAQWSNLSHCQTHNGAGNSQSGTVLKPLRCLAKIINKYSGELAQMQTWKKFFCFHDPIGELRKFLHCFGQEKTKKYPYTLFRKFVVCENTFMQKLSNSQPSPKLGVDFTFAL